MSEPSWGKWGSWEETESYVGKVVGVTKAPDAVELGAIRRWLEPKEFECALHSDKAAARSAGYRDIIAPNTMAFTYGIGPYWSPKDGLSEPGYEPRQISIPVIFNVPAPCKLSFATSVEIEFFDPIYVGDQITCTSKLVNLVKKELRVGAGAFFKQEDTYTNQDCAVVAIAHLDIFRFNPPAKKKAAS